MRRVSLPLSSIVLQGRTREEGSETTKLAGGLEGFPPTSRRKSQRRGERGTFTEQHRHHYPTDESRISRLTFEETEEFVNSLSKYSFADRSFVRPSKDKGKKKEHKFREELVSRIFCAFVASDRTQ